MTESETLWAYVRAADWYRRCLEDIQDGRSVAGLQEAKQGFIHADFAVRDLPDFDTMGPA